MGLDMYLYAKKHVNQYLEKDTYDRLVELLKAQDIITPDDFSGFNIDIPVAYWRKANAIHNYIITNYGHGEDNCEPIFLEKSHIRKLLDSCLKVIEDHNPADVMPTTSGFFFGSVEYDEYYYNQIDYTIKMCLRVLQNNKYDYFEYRASW